MRFIFSSIARELIMVVALTQTCWDNYRVLFNSCASLCTRWIDEYCHCQSTWSLHSSLYEVWRNEFHWLLCQCCLWPHLPFIWCIFPVILLGMKVVYIDWSSHSPDIESTRFSQSSENLAWHHRLFTYRIGWKVHLCLVLLSVWNVDWERTFDNKHLHNCGVLWILWYNILSDCFP